MSVPNTEYRSNSNLFKNAKIRYKSNFSLQDEEYSV